MNKYSLGWVGHHPLQCEILCRKFSKRVPNLGGTWDEVGIHNPLVPDSGLATTVHGRRVYRVLWLRVHWL